MANIKLINYTATFISVGLYLLILSFVIKISSEDIKKIKNFGYDIEKSIIVNLDTLPTSKNELKQSATKEQKPKIIKVSENIEKESKKDSRDIIEKDAKNLFSTMKVDKKRANEVEEKIKQEKTRSSRLKKQSAKELFKSSSIDKAKVKNELLKMKKLLSSSSKKNEIKGKYDDEFFAKISSIIMQKWNATIGTKDRLKATVILKIDKNGHLSYRNLKSSFNNIFDTKLKDFLDNLSKELLPKYKKGNFIEAEFLFTDREDSLG